MRCVGPSNGSAKAESVDCARLGGAARDLTLTSAKVVVESVLAVRGLAWRGVKCEPGAPAVLGARFGCAGRLAVRETFRAPIAINAVSNILCARCAVEADQLPLAEQVVAHREEQQTTLSGLHPFEHDVGQVCAHTSTMCNADNIISAIVIDILGLCGSFLVTNDFTFGTLDPTYTPVTYGIHI